MVAVKTCKGILYQQKSYSSITSYSGSMSHIALSLASDQEKLLKEVTTMLSFKHPNVMTLIGMCIDGEMPLIIMPYMSHGSVLGYVKQNKEELHFQVDGKANQEEVITPLVNKMLTINFLILCQNLR